MQAVSVVVNIHTREQNCSDRKKEPIFLVCLPGGTLNYMKTITVFVKIGEQPTSQLPGQTQLTTHIIGIEYSSPASKNTKSQ